MKKDWLGYILLPAAIVGIFGGMSIVSDGKHIGWLGIIVGLLLAVVSYRIMTPPRTVTPKATEDAATKPQPIDQGSPGSESKN